MSTFVSKLCDLSTTFLVGVVLVINLLAPTAHSADANSGFFIPAFNDWAMDAKEAQAQGKRGMFLFFEWDECPYCQKMRQTSLAMKGVQSFYRHYFAPIAVDINGAIAVTFFDGTTMKQGDIAKRYRVKLTPTMLFVDFNGHEIARHQGGLYTEKEMVDLGKRFLAAKQ